MLKRIDATLTVSKGSFKRTKNFKPDHIFSSKHLDLNFFDEITLLCIDKIIEEKEYFNFLEEKANNCFLPITASGRIRSLQDAQRLFNNGADRVIVNSLLWEDNNDILENISTIYGSQSLVASIDVIKEDNQFKSYDWINEKSRESLIPEILKNRSDLFGEIKIQAVDRDGGVIGPNILAIEEINNSMNSPIPLSYGSGLTSWNHYKTCLKKTYIKCVSATNVHHMSTIASRSLKEFCIRNGINLRMPQENQHFHNKI